MNFKINSRPLFTIILKLKNDNFKTRDFSPLIERVLACVNYLFRIYVGMYLSLIMITYFLHGSRFDVSSVISTMKVFV